MHGSRLQSSSSLKHLFPPPPNRHVLKTTAKCISDYELIVEGDRIIVAISGGKDSWVLLHLLEHFRRVSPVRFELIALTIHPGFSDFNLSGIASQMRIWNIPYEIVYTRIDETIEKHLDKNSNPCAFCARLRRGALYRKSLELNATKIALGHQADDAIETVFLSMLFEGRLCAIPPKLTVKDKPIDVIRPLIKVWEIDVLKYFKSLKLPLVKCPQTPTHSKRQQIKNLVQSITAEYPNSKYQILSALQNVRISHFLDSKWL